MKKTASALRNEKGITLIELLAVLAVSGIFLTVFYNVFMMGIKTYEKTSIEVQLREEADYVLSALLDTLDESKIDAARSCTSINGQPCLQFIQNKEIQKQNRADGSEGEIFVEGEALSETVITFTFGEQVTKETAIVTKNEKNEEVSREEDTATLTSQPYELVNPTADIICLERSIDEPDSCTSGLIEMTLSIQDANYTKESPIAVEPMTLTSQFGF
ncbi:type II secretion system protein [Metabacillus sp. 84]|uniref:type II secretion system protein n=1 Tax=unclassified Metabacillus TaxID=2675274 RepID=UPI003CF936F2